MTSPYVLDRVAYGRTEKVLDRRAFAQALAPLIGGAYVPPDDPADAQERNPEHQWVALQVGDLMIHVSREGYNAGNVHRVSLSCGPLRPVSRRLAGISVTKYPSMTADTGRPLDALAREVKRKLIEGSAEPLAKDLKTVADMDATKAGIEVARAALLKRFPFGATPQGDEKRVIRISEPGDRGNSAGFYASGPGFSVSGRLQSDGGIYVDRMSYDGKAEDFLAFLYGGLGA